MSVPVGPAILEDTAAIFALLEEHHLPVDGLREQIPTTLVARRGGRIIGSAALETCPDGVLLRSLAVARDFQGHGLGSELTGAALSLAKQLHAPAVYLLTTTAEGYFPRFGFERVTREDVPAGVRRSIEFTSACPASAIVMRLWL